MAIPRSTDARPLRLWPGVVIVILQWLLRFALPVVVPDALLYGLIGGLFGGALAIALWWVFFSRAPWSERLGAIVLMIVALFDKSASSTCRLQQGRKDSCCISWLSQACASPSYCGRWPLVISRTGFGAPPWSRPSC